MKNSKKKKRKKNKGRNGKNQGVCRGERVGGSGLVRVNIN